MPGFRQRVQSCKTRFRLNSLRLKVQLLKTFHRAKATFVVHRLRHD